MMRWNGLYMKDNGLRIYQMDKEKYLIPRINWYLKGNLLMERYKGRENSIIWTKLGIHYMMVIIKTAYTVEKEKYIQKLKKLCIKDNFIKEKWAGLENII